MPEARCPPVLDVPANPKVLFGPCQGTGPIQAAATVDTLGRTHQTRGCPIPAPRPAHSPVATTPAGHGRIQEGEVGHGRKVRTLSGVRWRGRLFRALEPAKVASPNWW